MRNPSDPHPELIHVWFGDSSNYLVAQKTVPMF